MSCGEDAAAYVLGALEPAEVEAFRVHLSECIVCRDEVGALGGVIDVLPLAAPQYAPPAGLRRRVLSAARADGRAARLPRLRLVPALAGALATAVVALAVLGVVELASSGGGATRVISASVTAPAASAELRIGGGRGELIVNRFPAPPAGHVYELWLMRPGLAPVPTGTLFSVTSRGSAQVGIPGSLSGVSAVLVTPEPAGGSPAPTTAPVIVARLT